MIVKVSLV